MKDNFVTYEIAVKLKYLRFTSEIYFGWCHGDGSGEIHIIVLEGNKVELNELIIGIPLLQQAQKWLREVHHIHIGIWHNTLTNKYRWERQIGEEYVDANEEFATYELALSEGLTEALKLIKI